MLYKTNDLPCFYHPTNVIFLDDNEHFLHTVKVGLGGKIDLQVFDNCASALKVFSGFDEFERVKNLVFRVNKEDSTQVSRIVEFNLSDLHKMIYDASRFQQISALVVDYQMPEMNGIEFCKQIQSQNVMKILLTAEADKDTAIAAFNQGIIHQFMIKTQDELDEVLLATIIKLQQAYFVRLSQIINDNLDKSSLMFMSSPVYLQLFAEAKQLSQAVEYYLLDKFGSVLFLDQQANPTWLIWRDEQAMQEYVDIAQEQAASLQVIAALKSRKKLLFQLTKQNMQLPIEQWQNYLFDAKTSDQKYYYSIIHSKTNNSVEWKHVVAYSKDN